MRQLYSRFLGIVWWMIIQNWMDLGDVNKHVHHNIFVIEDIIIMVEWNKIVGLEITRVGWMMMEGGMIETNRYDGVVFPMSMCVSEFELRLQGMWGREGCGWMVWKKEGKWGRWVGWKHHLGGRWVCCCWVHEGNESVMVNGMGCGWKGIWGWCCCGRCLEEGRWVDCNWGTWVKGGKEEWGGSGKRKWKKISEIGEGCVLEWLYWVWLKVDCDVEWECGLRGIEGGFWEGWDD